MISIFMAIISIMFLMVALTRPRIAFYIFVFLLPFLPRYIGLGIGQEGLALSQRRILAIMVFAGFIVYLLLLPNTMNRLRAILIKRPVYMFMNIVLLIYAVKMISTVVNSGIYHSIYVFDEMFVSVAVLLMVLAFVRDQNDERIIFILLMLGLFISELSSFLERIKEAPLLQGLFQVEVAIQGRDPLTGTVRADLNRVQALFDNPLLLSQFVCAMWPVAWLLRQDRTKLVRIVSWITIFSAPFTLLFVLSRSGFIVAVLSILIYGALIIYKRAGMLSKAWILTLYAIMIIFAGIIVADIFSHPYDYYDRTVVGGQSALARIMQYKIVSDVLAQSPIIGWGMTRNYVVDLNFLNNLDSYWLRILLEGGIVLGALYVILFITVIALCIKLIGRTNDKTVQPIVYAISTSLVAHVLYTFFISIPTNNIYLFLFSGLLLKRTIENRHQLDNVASSSP